MKYYTGIGSRNAPPEVLQKMEEKAKQLAEEGYILRSGGSTGSDSAFEKGSGGICEIYLPWLHFNGKIGIVYVETPEYWEVVKENHPNWMNLNHASRALIGRNYLELVGLNGQKSEFVLYWSRGPGGTQYTVNLARKLGIPCYEID